MRLDTLGILQGATGALPATSFVSRNDLLQVDKVAAMVEPDAELRDECPTLCRLFPHRTNGA